MQTPEDLGFLDRVTLHIPKFNQFGSKFGSKEACVGLFWLALAVSARDLS